MVYGPVQMRSYAHPANPPIVHLLRCSSPTVLAAPGRTRCPPGNPSGGGKWFCLPVDLRKHRSAREGDDDGLSARALALRFPTAPLTDIYAMCRPPTERVGSPSPRRQSLAYHLQSFTDVDITKYVPSVLLVNGLNFMITEWLPSHQVQSPSSYFPPRPKFSACLSLSGTLICIINSGRSFSSSGRVWPNLLGQCCGLTPSTWLTHGSFYTHFLQSLI